MTNRHLPLYMYDFDLLRLTLLHLLIVIIISLLFLHSSTRLWICSLLPIYIARRKESLFARVVCYILKIIYTSKNKHFIVVNTYIYSSISLFLFKFRKSGSRTGMKIDECMTLGFVMVLRLGVSVWSLRCASYC